MEFLLNMFSNILCLWPEITYHRTFPKAANDKYHVSSTYKVSPLKCAFCQAK